MFKAVSALFKAAIAASSAFGRLRANHKKTNFNPLSPIFTNVLNEFILIEKKLDQSRN